MTKARKLSAVAKLKLLGAIPGALDVEVDEGFDFEGEPAVWATLTVPANLPNEDLTGEVQEKVRTSVRSVLGLTGPSPVVYVRFKDSKDATEFARHC